MAYMLITQFDFVLLFAYYMHIYSFLLDLFPLPFPIMPRNKWWNVWEKWDSAWNLNWKWSAIQTKKERPSSVLVHTWWKYFTTFDLNLNHELWLYSGYIYDFCVPFGTAIMHILGALFSLLFFLLFLLFSWLFRR